MQLNCICCFCGHESKIWIPTTKKFAVKTLSKIKKITVEQF